MAGGISLSSALQLLDGTPHKKAAAAFVEKIPFAKVLSGGNLSGLLQSVLQNGSLSSVLQNPMAALTGAVAGQLPGLVGQLQGMAGGAPAALVQALTGAGGLGPTMGAFQAAGDNLAGLTNGAAGFFSMIGHDSLTQMAGSALPASASMATVTAPIASGAFLGSVNTQLPAVIGQVVAGTMSPDDATAWVQEQIATATSIITGSAAALAWGQSMQTMVSTVSAIAGSLAVPPVADSHGNRRQGSPTSFQSALSTIVQPGPRATMAQALDALTAHTRHDPVDVAAMTSLED